MATFFMLFPFIEKSMVSKTPLEGNVIGRTYGYRGQEWLESRFSCFSHFARRWSRHLLVKTVLTPEIRHYSRDVDLVNTAILECEEPSFANHPPDGTLLLTEKFGGDSHWPAAGFSKSFWN